VGSFLPGAPNAFDTGTITVKEDGTGLGWVFYIWNSRNDAPALERILQTQRLALLREAAFRGLKVHVWHEDASGNIDQVQVDL